ncbi:hypothetical protein C8Q77DRAFT_1272272 [Trametes polyzona]|nr:hypothetical protein C8Q77DRAFT_1272272 [Trametes polyzona]
MAVLRSPSRQPVLIYGRHKRPNALHMCVECERSQPPQGIAHPCYTLLGALRAPHTLTGAVGMHPDTGQNRYDRREEPKHAAGGALPPPPAYGPSGSPQGGLGYGQAPQGYAPPPQQQRYPSQVSQAGSGQFAPPQGPPPGAGYMPHEQQQQQQQQYQGAPMQPGYYPPGPQGPGGAPVQQLGAGAQYQQQLFAMCAAGHHDVQTKYGIAGIIGAIVFFPIGLLCLLADTEKRGATQARGWVGTSDITFWRQLGVVRD